MTDRPSAANIRAAREAAGLTQAQAAALILSTERTWQSWEQGERHMPLGKWELFRIKVTE